MKTEKEIYQTDEVELEPQKGEDLAPVVGNTPVNPDAYIARVEAWMDFVKKIHQAFVKTLNPRTDLCFLGDGDKQVVHLRKTAIDRLLAISGGEIKINKVERIDGEDERGKWYAFTTDAVFIRADGKRFEASYMVSSRNKFFGKAYGRDKAVTEILPDYVREASITWAIKRAIAKGLGIGSFTIQQLRDYGVRVEEIDGYVYQSSEKTSNLDGKIGIKEINEIERYRQKKNATAEQILQAVKQLGYTALSDIPIVRYEELKCLIKSICERGTNNE